MDNDDALAARLARDLDGAFPDLVAGHADRLYSIALRLLGDPSDAEEVAQDALVRAYPRDAPATAARRDRGAPAPAVARRRSPSTWPATAGAGYADRQPPSSLEPLTEAGFDPRDRRHAPTRHAVAEPPRDAARAGRRSCSSSRRRSAPRSCSATSTA